MQWYCVEIHGDKNCSKKRDSTHTQLKYLVWLWYVLKRRYTFSQAYTFQE